MRNQPSPQRAWAALLAAATIVSLQACEAGHTARGFASAVEMRTAQANGYLTKARLDASMAPAPIREYPTPAMPTDLAHPSTAAARSMIELCGLPQSCALAVLAAARESDAAAMQAGMAKMMALPQDNRVAGDAGDDLSLARLILRQSSTQPSLAFESATNALQADPRRSGAWLGLAGALMTQGQPNDAWAAVWLSWHLSKDRAAARERIQRCFLAESNPVIKAMYGPAIAWIDRGASPFTKRVQHG